MQPATTINGSIVHVVPLLTDRGVPRGLIAAGYRVDRIFAPCIVLVFLLFPVAGNPILASGVSGSGPVAGTGQLGTGIGAEIDLMLFVISRYFGMGFFGAVDGFTFAFLLIGSAVSASTLGWVFHIAQSRTPSAVSFQILLATAGVLTMTSGHIAIQPRAKAEGKVSAVRGKKTVGHRQTLASRSAKQPTASCISLSREPAVQFRGRRPLASCQSRN